MAVLCDAFGDEGEKPEPWHIGLTLVDEFAQRSFIPGWKDTPEKIADISRCDGYSSLDAKLFPDRLEAWEAKRDERRAVR